MEQVHYIREIMQRQGVSIAQLAERVGVTKSAAASYLVHDLRVSKAAKIAEALGVSLSALFVKPETYVPPIDKSEATTIVKCPKCGAELELSAKK